jgi:surfeit locus 1 family protein
VIVSGKGSLEFHPPKWALAVLIPLLGLAIAAGIWQLDRAKEKSRLFRSFDNGTGTGILTELIPVAQINELRYRVVRLSGYYDSDHQILLDSMMHQGQVGYQVLTPFRSNAKTAMVNRGWILASPDREILPTITVDDEPRQILARLDRLPRPGLELGSSDNSSEMAWPRRLLFPKAKQLSEQIGYEIQDYQLLLDSEAADGYQRNWRPAVLPPERHVGYAVQWFAIAAALIVIYAVVNLKRAKEPTDNE